MLEIICNPLGNKIHRVQYLLNIFILAHKATVATLCNNVLNRIPHNYILRALEIVTALRCTRGIIINKRTCIYFPEKMPTISFVYTC